MLKSAVILDSIILLLSFCGETILTNTWSWISAETSCYPCLTESVTWPARPLISTSPKLFDEALCRSERISTLICFVNTSLEEALKLSVNVNIKQHYSLQTAAPQQRWMVIKWVFVGSCRGNQMGLLWRYRLEKDGVELYLVIFLVNPCKWLINVGSEGQSAGCIESDCSSWLTTTTTLQKAISVSGIVFLIPHSTPITEQTHTHMHMLHIYSSRSQCRFIHKYIKVHAHIFMHKLHPQNMYFHTHEVHTSLSAQRHTHVYKQKRNL